MPPTKRPPRTGRSKPATKAKAKAKAKTRNPSPVSSSSPPSSSAAYANSDADADAEADAHNEASPSPLSAASARMISSSSSEGRGEDKTVPTAAIVRREMKEAVRWWLLSCFLALSLIMLFCVVLCSASFCFSSSSPLVHPLQPIRSLTLERTSATPYSVPNPSTHLPP